MVEQSSGAAHGSGVPTIAELLSDYRDRTGHSYGDMARKVRDEIRGNRLQQLVTAAPKAFPETRTVELLSELLDLPVTTIVLAFAAGLGIPVTQDPTPVVLPPGTDTLAPEDKQAIRAITRALIVARNAAAHGDPGPINSPEPAQQIDYGLAARRGSSEGKRLRQVQDEDAESQ